MRDIIDEINLDILPDEFVEKRRPVEYAAFKEKHKAAKKKIYNATANLRNAHREMQSFSCQSRMNGLSEGFMDTGAIDLQIINLRDSCGDLVDAEAEIHKMKMDLFKQAYRCAPQKPKGRVTTIEVVPDPAVSDSTHTLSRKEAEFLGGIRIPCHRSDSLTQDSERASASSPTPKKPASFTRKLPSSARSTEKY